MSKKRRRPFTDENSFTAGSWLAEAMKKGGITQSELAKRTGKARAHLSRVVNSRTDPMFGTLMELIRACGVEIVVEFRNHQSNKV